MRKVEPLNKILETADGWVTGMTRAQSDGRSNIPFVEYDDAHGMLKFNPIADLTVEELEAARRLNMTYRSMRSMRATILP